MFLLKLLRYLVFLLSGRKSKVKSLGQAGLIYDRNGIKYNIDSEITGAGQADLVIFWKNMHLVDRPEAEISEKEKQTIAEEVIKELKAQGSIGELDPEIFPRWQ
jgi:hypothetical protein